MSPADRRDPPTWYERPRRVEGGVRARTKRGSIGQEWWSRRFIDVLESFGMHGRLARGRSYARAGQIVDFTLTAGYVTAHVQGSRPRPYRVRIKVLPLTTAQWQRVEQALAAQALFRAGLLAGEMPPEIEQVFAGCGTPLFPRSLGDLDMSCTCPDWGVPCKHIAATLYVLAEKFDEDPFLVLAWRGRGRDQLLGRLRQLTPAPADAGPAPHAGPAQHGGPGPTPQTTAAPLGDVADPPLADCLGTFWSPGISRGRLRTEPVAPATAPDLLLRSTEPPPVRIGRSDLVTLLRPAYLRMTGGEGG